MLVNEAGPGRLFIKLREATGVVHDDQGGILAHNDWTPLYCVWCTSMYVAALLYWLPDWFKHVLSASTIAIAIDERLK